MNISISSIFRDQILDIHVPIKKKLLRANHVPYMTKVLRKAIVQKGLNSKANM